MPNPLPRRQFLRQSALATAGLVASASVARTEDKPSQKIVLGVMGLSRGRALATQFAQLPGVEIRYVCDVDAKRVAQGATAVEKTGAGRPQEIGDFRRILDDKDVDALVCAAPNHWHAPATILACAAGKHVYVEKPCSHNPREGELMIAAARKHDRAVQMGTQRRSGDRIIEAMEALHSGAIGKVYSARAVYASARGSIGTGKPAAVPEQLDYDLWQGPAPRKAWLNNRVHYNWHWFWHWGNGELGNNGVHTLDLCRWGLGVEYPKRITSSGGRYCFQDDQETPDTSTVTFEFDDGKMASWQGYSCNRHDAGDFITFYGEGGALELEDGGNYTIFDTDHKVVHTADKGNRGDIEHLQNFLSAIREGKHTALNAEIEIGHKSTLLCHLGNIAQRTGRALHCDTSTGHVLDDADAMKLWARNYEPGWAPKV